MTTDERLDEMQHELDAVRGLLVSACSRKGAHWRRLERHAERLGELEEDTPTLQAHGDLADKVHELAKRVVGQTSGIPLRDWFAGQALAGLNANPSYYQPYRNMAQWAFAEADAMLAEREES